jgi:hypothetical protein
VTTIREYNKDHPNLHCWKRWNRSGALDPEPVDIDRWMVRVVGKEGAGGGFSRTMIIFPLPSLFLLSCNKVWQVYCTNPGLLASSVEEFAFGGKVDPQIRPVFWEFFGVKWGCTCDR